MRLIHFSSTSRMAGCRGGVEKFAWYLQKAVGCEIRTFSDPPPRRFDGIAIVDGGCGTFFDKEQPLVSVIHGTWKEMHRRCGMSNGPEVVAQDEVWTRPDVATVAVSEASARELRHHHKVDATTVIPHGVDTDVFVPDGHVVGERPVVIHAATDFKKRDSDMPRLAELLSEFEVRFLDAQIGEEAAKYAAGDLFVHAAKHEGNAYSVLEAISCNLPIAASRVGLLEDMDSPVGVLFDADVSVETIALHVRECWKRRKEFSSRSYALKYANFDSFKEQWIDFLSYIEHSVINRRC